MARYLSNINLTGNQLQNAVIHATGTEPTGLAAGQIYYNSGNNKVYIYDGATWSIISGDIEEVIAGAGLVGGGTSGSVTLSLDISGVTADTYGSSTSIPVITIDQYGRITSATTASISTTLTVAADSGSGDGVDLASDTLTIAGTANEIETSISGDTVTIGLPNDVTIGNNLVVSGNLTVSGTTTTVNTETINLADNIITLNSNATGQASENAGIEIERGDQANMSLFWDETADRWKFTYVSGPDTEEALIPIPSELIAPILDREYVTSIGDGVATSYTVTHNLGTRDVIVQLFDNSTYDTVYADVERTTVNTLTVVFASAPTTNDIRVLVKQIG